MAIITITVYAADANAAEQVAERRSDASERTREPTTVSSAY